MEYKFQDKNLYDKLRALVIKAFVLLQEKIKDGNKIEFTTIVEGGLVVHEDGKLSSARALNG